MNSINPGNAYVSSELLHSILLPILLVLQNIEGKQNMANSQVADILQYSLAIKAGVDSIKNQVSGLPALIDEKLGQEVGQLSAIYNQIAELQRKVDSGLPFAPEDTQALQDALLNLQTVQAALGDITPELIQPVLASIDKISALVPDEVPAVDPVVEPTPEVPAPIDPVAELPTPEVPAVDPVVPAPIEEPATPPVVEPTPIENVEPVRSPVETPVVDPIL